MEIHLEDSEERREGHFKDLLDVCVKGAVGRGMEEREAGERRGEEGS